MHKLVDLGPQVPREPCMWKKLHMFLEQYPPEKEFPDTKRLAENNISRQRLTGYFQWVSRIILPIRPKCYKCYFVTKIVLTYCEKKIVPVIEKNFWNSRLKAENLQNFWDHWNNLFKQWKFRTIFGNRMLFNLFLEVSHI